MSETYVILVKGHIDQRYFSWCRQVAVTHMDDGKSLLTAATRDQAELFGLLVHIRDLGLTLLSITSERAGTE